MATIYSFQFTCKPLLDACGLLSVSSSDLKKYYPSYYRNAIVEADGSNLYSISFCNCSAYPGRFRTYYAVLPFRSISSYVTPSGKVSPCLSESQLKRFALIVRCCHYRYFRAVGKINVYRDICGLNLERAL